MDRQRRLPRLFRRRGWTRHRTSSDVLWVEPSATNVGGVRLFARQQRDQSPITVDLSRTEVQKLSRELRRASRGAATAGIDTAIIPEPLLAEPVGVLVPYLRSMGLPSVVIDDATGRTVSPDAFDGLTIIATDPEPELLLHKGTLVKISVRTTEP